MTDRINALTVILKDDIREDDIQGLLNAMKMFSQVLDVKLNIENLDETIAESRVRHSLTVQLWKVLNP